MSWTLHLREVTKIATLKMDNGKWTDVWYLDRITSWTNCGRRTQQRKYGSHSTTLSGLFNWMCERERGWDREREREKTCKEIREPFFLKQWGCTGKRSRWLDHEHRALLSCLLTVMFTLSPSSLAPFFSLFSFPLAFSFVDLSSFRIHTISPFHFWSLFLPYSGWKRRKKERLSTPIRIDGVRSQSSILLGLRERANYSKPKRPFRLESLKKHRLLFQFSQPYSYAAPVPFKNVDKENWLSIWRLSKIKAS